MREQIKVIKAPNLYTKEPRTKIVFLAGSIEMGKAEPWQDKVGKQIGKLIQNRSVIVLNPRRDDWDSSWIQDKKSPPFHEQVTWELNGLIDADVIGMYFDPNTKSPITLLEFGLNATSGKLIVCCPKGFHRKGNVDIVCERYSIPQVDSLQDLTAIIVNKITEKK